MRKRVVLVVATLLVLLIAVHPVVANEQLARVKAAGKCTDSITQIIKRLLIEYHPATGAGANWAVILNTKIGLLVLELGDLNVKMTKHEMLTKVDEILRKCQGVKSRD